MPVHGRWQETEFEDFVSALWRCWKVIQELGASVEKAKTVSRSVIQQRTVEQIVGLLVAKVVDSAPQMVVQLVQVRKTPSRDMTSSSEFASRSSAGRFGKECGNSWAVLGH